MQKSKKNSILITGGTGFFGRALLRNWLNRVNDGEEIANICVLSRDPEKFLKNYPEFKNGGWLKFHCGDILNPATLPKNEKFTHLLHAATDSTLGPQLTPIERYTQIVEGTRNMLEYSVKNNISRFLLTSSGGVYGPQPLKLNFIPETFQGMHDPLNPENTYSLGKHCAEHLCALYRNQFEIETVIARCFSFVGRDLPLDVHFAIGNFISKAINNEDIIIKGNGKQIRSYLDQRDLAAWLETLLFYGIDGDAYNVGSDNAISLKDLAELVRKLIEPGIKIIVRNKKNKNNNREKYVPEIEKIKRKHKLKINYTLEQSILEIVKIYKAKIKEI